MFYRRVSLWLLSILVFAIPIEHKYDKVFRFFSLKLIPENVILPAFFDKKIYFYPSDLIALGLLILALFTMRRRFLISRGAVYLWALFLLTFVSILLSPLSHYPLIYIRLLQLLTPIILFCFIANGFLDKEKLTKSLFLALIGAALIQSCIGIAQYATQGPLGLRLFGEPGTFPYFWMYSGKIWLFAADTLKEPLRVIRASGTLPHSNVLGGFLTISILACYSFFSSPRLRPLFFLIVPLLFFAMMLTFSRAALFGLALGTLVWLLFSLKKRGLGVPTLLSSLALSILFSAITLYQPIALRGGIVNYNKYAQKSDNLRLHYQNIALNMVQDHPLSGVGYQQLSIRSLDYAPDELDRPASSGAHNIYLYMAAETGIPSLLVFLGFILTLFWGSLKTPFTPLFASLFAIFIAFLFIGGCDFYPLLFQQGKLPFFLMAGLLGAHAVFKKEIVPPRENIWKMFDRLSPNYDRLNSILSFGMDLSWRKRAASYLPKKQDLKLLDLASGTADQLIACFESGASIQKGIGIDLSTEMLKIGETKLLGKPYKMKTELKRGDAENLPFPDDSFDAATFSFGIRNVQNPLSSLKEIHRVLKPGGRCIILELSMPRGALRGPHLFYLRHILPGLGGFFSKQKEAYTYLNQTIETFPSGAAFCSLLENASFRSIKKIPMTLGAVTIYLGEKK